MKKGKKRKEKELNPFEAIELKIPFRTGILRLKFYSLADMLEYLNKKFG